MKYVVWILVLGLLVLHQDFWQAGNATLVLGVLPYSLAYHAALTVAAAVVWGLAVQFAWPQHLEDEAMTAMRARTSLEASSAGPPDTAGDPSGDPTDHSTGNSTGHSTGGQA